MSAELWIDDTASRATDEPPEAKDASPDDAQKRGDGAVAALVRQLATAARAFILYDVRNDTVRRALAGLLQGFETVLGATPRLRLAIRSFQIEFEGRCIYLDRDPEHSLAFRLHRDGIRTLSFRAGFDAAELARLLEILSLRYTGIHQHEDDTVSLLWKAGLPHLEVVAVEGLTLAGGATDVSAHERVSEPRPYLPEDVDLPLAAAAGEETPEWVELEPGTVDALRDEVASTSLPAASLQLLAALMRALEDAEERMRFAEASHLCEEMRDALLSFDTLPQLVSFVHQLRQIACSEAPWDPERHRAAVGLILSCGSDRAVQRLIHSVPATEQRLRNEMVELLDMACPDPFTAVAEALTVEERPSGRAAARQLLEHYGKRSGAFIRQRFEAARGRAAADLLRSLSRLDDETLPAFLARQCAHPDPEVREEALWHIERTAFSSALGLGLAEALRRTEGAHRRRILGLIERSRDRRFVPALVRLIESAGQHPAEAAEIARAIGRLEGRQGLERWRRWLTPKGRFLRRRLPGSTEQQVLAATAVAQMPGEDATRLLRLAHSAAAGEARLRIEEELEDRGPLTPASERARRCAGHRLGSAVPLAMGEAG